MTHLIGPDFIGIQAEDLGAAKAFYNGRLGMPVMEGPPDAVVFDSKPIPFAVRKPLPGFDATTAHPGAGIALWFACTDAEALHNELLAEGVPVLYAPKDGPFGKYFAFRDPFGYAITAHTA